MRMYEMWYRWIIGNVIIIVNVCMYLIIDYIIYYDWSCGIYILIGEYCLIDMRLGIIMMIYEYIML